MLALSPIFLAIFFDILDGRLARLSTQVTNFGKELDFLADMVSSEYLQPLSSTNFRFQLLEDRDSLFLFSM